MMNNQAPTFLILTDKQREILPYLADNHTSKEIARVIGISESAVVQRVEGIRRRFHGASRTEIGRRYRDWAGSYETCNRLTGKPIQVRKHHDINQLGFQDDQSGTIDLADSATFSVQTPWQRLPEVVPKALDGENAGLNRWIAVLKIAIGLVILPLVGLAIAQALSNVI
ncbi:response regulator transcription factor [Altererythrobacter aquiaggeris]|uniref:response regulator transcription factor n=1 Tax=Aestuarierythrobacter aquiaggeris TaxID=1898396 RepID=UPI003019CFB9